VDDPVAVREVERGAHVGDDLHRPPRHQPALDLQHVAQGPALDVLHDDVRLVAVHVLLAGVVDRDDRRVVQRRGGLRLTPEPGLERGVAGEIGAQHLDRDLPAEPDVATAVHLGHAAVAERLADLIPGSQQAWRRHRTLVVIEPIETPVFQSRLSAAAATGWTAEKAWSPPLSDISTVAMPARISASSRASAIQSGRRVARRGGTSPGGAVQPAGGVGVHCGWASAGLGAPTPSRLRWGWGSG